MGWQEDRDAIYVRLNHEIEAIRTAQAELLANLRAARVPMETLNVARKSLDASILRLREKQRAIDTAGR